MKLISFIRMPVVGWAIKIMKYFFTMKILRYFSTFDALKNNTQMR